MRIMNKNINCLLIANRGEIALRIIRSCRKIGIRSAVVYAIADAQMPFVREADIAISLNALQVSESYLHIDKIIAAAKTAGADAIHPGYGFLSENASFARKVIAEGLIWVGPNPEAIEEMGLKARAKTIAEANDVPTIPGYKGMEQDPAFLKEKANEIGFPILLKASAGGGGKGMRIVHEEQFLQQAIEAAGREAFSSFGDGTLLLEKYFPAARHIEIQVLGDKYGNCIHLLERECSIQRRYQKVIEESPSPILSKENREKMGAAAVRLCKAIGYDNAGTVEFIYTAEGQFYFLEVNTRLQVEHPVTEAVTGIDIVEWQINIAEGKALTLAQSDIKGNGYALECRLYAESPLNNFLPASGKILDWYSPSMDGLRIDSGIETGTEVGVYYDPMLAKVIVHGSDRITVIRKMSYALEHLRCQGLITNQRFLQKLMCEPHFQKGEYDTHYLTEKFALEKALALNSEHLIEAAITILIFRWRIRQKNIKLLKGIPNGWRNNFYRNQQETFFCEGEALQLFYRNIGDNHFLIRIDNREFEVALKHACDKEIRIIIGSVQQTFFVASDDEMQYFVHHPLSGSLDVKLMPRYPEVEQEKIMGGYEAPMPGEIIKLLVEIGQEVEEGTPLLILVSMKMENTILAAVSGIVEDIYVENNEKVKAGKLLLKIV